MSFSVKAMPAHAVIITVLQHYFDSSQETSALIQDLITQLAHMPGPASLIAVIDEAETPTHHAQSLLASLADGQHSVLSHPKVKAMIVVTTDATLTLSALALSRVGEPTPPILVAPTLAEAIAQAT